MVSLKSMLLLKLFSGDFEGGEMGGDLETGDIGGDFE